MHKTVKLHAMEKSENIFDLNLTDVSLPNKNKFQLTVIDLKNKKSGFV